MGRFLLRAQDHNMTNGDFAFFTFFTLKSEYTDRPWEYWVEDKGDIPRLLRVLQVVKEVCAFYLLLKYRYIVIIR